MFSPDVCTITYFRGTYSKKKRDWFSVLRTKRRAVHAGERVAINTGSSKHPTSHQTCFPSQLCRCQCVSMDLVQCHSDMLSVRFFVLCRSLFNHLPFLCHRHLWKPCVMLYFNGCTDMSLHCVCKWFFPRTTLGMDALCHTKLPFLCRLFLIKWKWNEDTLWPENWVKCTNISSYMLHLSVLSTFIQVMLFFASDFSSSGYSPIGSLFTIEKQKKLARDTYLILLCKWYLFCYFCHIFWHCL